MKTIIIFVFLNSKPCSMKWIHISSPFNSNDSILFFFLADDWSSSLESICRYFFFSLKQKLCCKANSYLRTSKIGGKTKSYWFHLKTNVKTIIKINCTFTQKKVKVNKMGSINYLCMNITFVCFFSSSSSKGQMLIFNQFFVTSQTYQKPIFKIILI